MIREVCVHGQLLESSCAECARDFGGTTRSMGVPLETHEPVGDARAQLWARVYAAEYDLCRREYGGSRSTRLLMRDGETTHGEYATRCAREAADAAARDFDEHYCGGKR